MKFPHCANATFLRTDVIRIETEVLASQKFTLLNSRKIKTCFREMKCFSCILLLSKSGNIPGFILDQFYSVVMGVILTTVGNQPPSSRREVAHWANT